MHPKRFFKVKTDYFTRFSFESSNENVYSHSVKKFLPGFPEPQYSDDSYYYPCGVPVVLMPDSDYKSEVLEKQPGIPLLFKNHMLLPYYYLVNKIYTEN